VPRVREGWRALIGKGLKSHVEGHGT
jgi:hypothetical protein